MNPKQLVPWYAKIGAKLVLARIPAGYDRWRSLSIFKHGKMHEPAYALDTFRQQYERSGLAGRPEQVHLELGPGDSLFSALISAAHGASTTYLMDVGRFAVDDLQAYAQMHAYLESQGLALPDADLNGDLDTLLTSLGAEYHTSGLDGLRALPDASVDFTWSNAVLEHVRVDDFAETARQLRRVTKADGKGRHRIDIRDHLAEALHSLRFPASVWESELFARSGFYTNRLRRDALVKHFEDAGFDVKVTREVRWPNLPTARWKLHRDFRDLPDEELLVAGFDVELTPR